MKKIINNCMRFILASCFFIFFSCDKGVVVDAPETVSRNTTLNDSSLGGGVGNIDDYFYDLDEDVQAHFLYYNSYMTRGANTINNPSGLNPYLDTLNFRTFPNHSVSGGSQGTETLIGLTPENVTQYSQLYELDELDTSVEDWCNKVLVEYDGACPASVEVDFDFSYSNSSTTGQNVDSVKSRGVFSDILSPKTSTFEVAWMNIDSLVWDNNNGRYDVITADETQKLSATLAYDDDTFDSLIYIGVIDADRHPVNDLMLVDRMEWERFDTTYNLHSNKTITLDTTFIYNQVKVPDDSPMFRINGDCNQNLIYDSKEEFFDFGQDWCPDSLETGQGKCLADESPCNCGSVINSDWQSAKSANNINDCISLGGYWLTYGTNECEFDPNGDNWRDCGWDGKCSDHPEYVAPDANDTQGNEVWDTREGMELNGRYDFDLETSTGDYFVDEGNGVSDEPAEFCFNLTKDSNGEDICSGSTPFEDRNCNGKWDGQEVGDKGNGIWDDDEKFIDSSGEGDWDAGEPLYSLSDRMQSFIVDYTNPAIPIAITGFSPSTQVTLYSGTYLSPEYVSYDNFLETVEISASYSESFYDIDRKVTIYTNKIIESPVPGEENDYHITKTRWYQDVTGTSFVESDLRNPHYGFDYSLPVRPSEYGYDYHMFKKSDNGNILKMVHPEYFKYYGYHESFEDFDAGTWQEELLSEETYIYTYGGNLRHGEYVFHDTTIITPVADYYVETLYEVELDGNVIVPFAEVTWEAFSGGDTVCINTPEPVWVNHPEVSFNIPDYQANYRKFCPPVDTVLTNTFKIIKTKTMTMIGTGLELGLRNTMWLGSGGTGNPYGIVKDQLEMRWSEPYWRDVDSDWTVVSRLELTSLHKTESSSLSRFLKPVKRMSLQKFVNEVEFDNDPYMHDRSYGIHGLRLRHGE